MSDNQNCGSGQCSASNAKYFFISAAGTKYIDVASMIDSVNSEMSDIDKLLNEAEDKPKLKGKMPITQHSNVVMESINGMFVPSMIENYIKTAHGLDEVSITFVREISKAEYDFDRKYRDDLNKPKPLGYDTMQEIDDLVNRTQTGDLSVPHDLRPDFARNETEKDLMDLGLPMNLFDESGLWDDDQENGES